MKKIVTVLAGVMAIVLLLGGCMFSGGRGSRVETPLTLRNSTDYEIESFAFQFMGSLEIKRITPMEQPVKEDGTFDDTSLKSGEEREFTFNIGTNELPEKWGVNMSIAGVEKLCYSKGLITFDGVKGYEITLDDSPDENGNPQFLFTAMDDDAGGGAGEPPKE
jgi:hypothetical protein